MERSIAARHAVRPVARFPRPTDRARSRRLGLRAFGSIVAAPSRPTVIRQAELGLLVQLRAGWRSIAPAQPTRPRSGAPRPAVGMHWSGAARAGVDRRSSAAPAPWRG